MEMREQLINQIVEQEWEMFIRVSNEGGRASCQDDRITFDIMRRSQFVIWNQEALTSYLEDLERAGTEARNLMTEKYGYMMADTAPAEYERIRSRLPQISKEKQRLTERLVEIQVAWMEAFRQQFPEYGSQGRALRNSEALPGDTSIETYARGELLTYSEKTLDALSRCFEQMKEAGINGGFLIMEETARRYGFPSLEAAEEQCRRNCRKNI